jgi:hypothetical protein
MPTLTHLFKLSKNIIFFLLRNRNPIIQRKTRIVIQPTSDDEHFEHDIRKRLRIGHLLHHG